MTAWEEVEMTTSVEMGLAILPKTSSEELKELYTTTKQGLIKRLIMIHPNCPTELKVAEEL